MNLFILDQSAITAAKYNADTHVCKIILESAQMLALAHQHHHKPFGATSPQALRDGKYSPQSQRNNPISVWVRSTLGNYSWTADHAIALCEEYTDRYNKIHSTQPIIEYLYNNPPMGDNQQITEFVQSMPDDVKGPDPVQAYRKYYVHYKRHLIRYRNGNMPTWYAQELHQLLESSQPLGS